MPSKVHYGIAADELALGQVDSDLWAMSMAQSNGDRDRAVSAYLTMRAEEIEREEARENIDAFKRRTVEAGKRVVAGPIKVVDSIATGIGVIMVVVFLLCLVLGVFALIINGFRSLL